MPVERRAGQQHGEPRARHGQHPDGALPRGHAPGGADRRPDPGARRDRRAGVPPGAGGARAGAASCRRRSSGSRCPPARRSRWTPAPRTWTGSPGCCAALIEFTQDGGEINVVVTGINVGAQPYWNAEATMLMHTKGILVMTPDSAMVLTGKQSLDYSGGVSAEDNFGIGGYDRIMGPNGQAQYWAPDLSGAVDVLLAHYAHTYRAPGERFPRPAPTTDPVDRDVRDAPHAGRRVHPRRGDLRPRDEPRAQEAVRHPLGAARRRRRRPPAAGALGGHAGRRERRRARRAPGRAAGGAAGHRVAAAAAARPDAGGRSDDVHGGHAVPAVVEEDRAGDQRGEREPAAGGAGEPVGLRRLARVAAPAAAGVRRGDRPGGGQLRRADRVLRGLAAITAGRSSCSPGR